MLCLHLTLPGALLGRIPPLTLPDALLGQFPPLTLPGALLGRIPPLTMPGALLGRIPLPTIRIAPLTRQVPRRCGQDRDGVRGARGVHRVRSILRRTHVEGSQGTEGGRQLYQGGR